MWRFIKCNLFHRGEWLGIREIERMGGRLSKPIHCLICDGAIKKAVKKQKYKKQTVVI